MESATSAATRPARPLRRAICARASPSAGRRRPDWTRDRAAVALLASLVALLVLFLLCLGYLGADRPGRQVALERDLARWPTQSQIERIELRDQDAVLVAHLDDGATVSVAYPANGAVTDDARRRRRTRRGAVVRVDQQGRKESIRTITTFLLPLMILANLFALLFVAGRAGGGGAGGDRDVRHAAQGGKGDARRSTGVTFDDVAGADEAVDRAAARSSTTCATRRATRAVGAVAAQGRAAVRPARLRQDADRPRGRGRGRRSVLLASRGAEFVESLVGVGAARVRDLFAKVREVAPAIVFIDELDAAGAPPRRRRLERRLATSASRRSTSCWSRSTASTSQPASSSSAPPTARTSSTRRCCAPGRFDRHVTVDQPDAEGRQQILELHARGKPIDPSVDFARARQAHAGLHRRRPGQRHQRGGAADRPRAARATIDEDLLDEAVQRVLHGPQRRGRVLTDAERERAAVHESGHAIVAAALGPRAGRPPRLDPRRAGAAWA